MIGIVIQLNQIKGGEMVYLNALMAQVKYLAFGTDLEADMKFQCLYGSIKVLERLTSLRHTTTNFNASMAQLKLF